MNNIKRKIPSFVFGVSIGLIAGVAFFLFKLDDYFTKMKNSTLNTVKVIEQPVSNEKKESDNYTSKEKFKINTSKSSKINYKEVDSLIQQEEPNSDDELNVATDELLTIKNVKLINLDSEVPIDTTAAALAGVNTQKFTDLYFIEFWKTPLNSKGYRMTKNKVMLYGFNDYSNLSIFKVDGGYYIKNSEQVYKVVPGSDFKPLERVLDNDLLARLF
jgi:hypothetical protein